MEYVAHGGGCCGYGHVFGFDHATVERLDECIQRHLDAAGGNNRILEAILTDRQLAPAANENRIPASVTQAGGWAAVLAARGFRLAAAWTNSNTGRRCYQFLKIPDLISDGVGRAFLEILPFQWTGEINVPIPAPRVVHRQDVPVVGMRVMNLRTGAQGRIRAVYEADSRYTVTFNDGLNGNYRLDNFRNAFSVLDEPANPQPQPQPAPPPPVVRRIYATEWYANLRQGGRRGPFGSPAQAREAYPRCARFERRDIYNDGTSTWVNIDGN